MGRSSKSCAIFAAAWKPCTRTRVMPSVSIWLWGPRAKTHLDPIHNAGDVAGLQQELLSLHAHAYHVLPLEIVAPQPALRPVQRVRTQEVLLLRVRHGGVVDPQVPPLHARRAMGALWRRVDYERERGKSPEPVGVHIGVWATRGSGRRGAVVCAGAGVWPHLTR